MKKRESLLVDHFGKYRLGSQIALLTIFSIVAISYYVWTWSHGLGDFLGGDNAVYLLTAQHFSPWSSASEVAAYFSAHSQYPPLYPFVLAIFGGAESMLAAHFITTTILLCAFIFYYIWVRQIGMSVPLAAATVLLFALLPCTYFQALAVLSENLFLLLLLAALVAVEAYESSRRDAWLLVAAVCVAGAVLTRSAGLSLVAVFVLYLWLRRPARFWTFALVAVLPFVLWQVSHRAGSGYLHSLVEIYGSDPSGHFYDLLKAEAQMLWHAWASNFTSISIGKPVMGFVLAVCLIGTMHRVYRRTFDGLFTVAYLLLILVWPFPAEAPRLLYVVTPILLAHGLMLLLPLSKMRSGSIMAGAPMALLAAMLLLVAPGLLLTIKRYMQPMPADLEAFRYTARWYVDDPRLALENLMSDKLLVDHMRQLREVVPPGDCVYSIKPSLTALFGDRISLTPPREYLNDQEFERSISESGCRFFYLMTIVTPSYGVPLYPAARLPERLRIIRVTGMPGRDVIAIIAELIR